MFHSLQPRSAPSAHPSCSASVVVFASVDADCFGCHSTGNTRFFCSPLRSSPLSCALQCSSSPDAIACGHSCRSCRFAVVSLEPNALAIYVSLLTITSPFSPFFSSHSSVVAVSAASVCPGPFAVGSITPSIPSLVIDSKRSSPTPILSNTPEPVTVTVPSPVAARTRSHGGPVPTPSARLSSSSTPSSSPSPPSASPPLSCPVTPPHEFHNHYCCDFYDPDSAADYCYPLDFKIVGPMAPACSRHFIQHVDDSPIQWAARSRLFFPGASATDRKRRWRKLVALHRNLSIEK